MNKKYLVKVVRDEHGEYDMMFSPKAIKRNISARIKEDRCVVSFKDSKIKLNKLKAYDRKNKEVAVRVDTKAGELSFACTEQGEYCVREKRPFLIIALPGILTLGVILALLFVHPGHAPVIQDDPSGAYSIGEQRVKTMDEIAESDTITFAGRGAYIVSADAPDIELRNPEENFINMRFLVKDHESGTEIAYTDTIAPGQYVYVNIYDFYKDCKGQHKIDIGNEAYDAEGFGLNGANSTADITVK